MNSSKKLSAELFLYSSTIRKRIGLFAACAAAALPAMVHATTYPVTSTADDGSTGTLRWAINQADANPGSTINFSVAANSTVTLVSGLPQITASVTIDGTGSSGLSISGNNAYRVFFVNDSSTSAPNVMIENLNIVNGLGQGGSGGTSGGGGLGAGGGLFVGAGNVSVANVSFSGSAAHGGNGGDANSSLPGGGGGGGGGLGGNGGHGDNFGGAGGGGYSDKGQDSPGTENGGNGGGYAGVGGGAGGNEGNGGNGGPNGGGGGGGTFAAGGNGGNYGGGGGNSIDGDSAAGAGGLGGGGGGGGVGNSSSGPGGSGGFGGGGGGSASTGGTTGGGAGGTGGGAGGGSLGTATGGGGGGAAFGGAVFVQQGATIGFTNTSLDAGSLVAGNGGAGTASLANPITSYDGASGSSAATSLYLMGGNSTLNVSGGKTSTIIGSIVESSAGSLTIAGSNGGGTLVLDSANSYTGGTIINAATLSISNDNALGDSKGAVTILNGGNLQFTSSIVTSRTFSLGTSILTPPAGGSITYNIATINDGSLGAGSQLLNTGTSLNQTRLASGSVVTQSGTVSFNNVTLSNGASFTQNPSAILNTTGDFVMLPTSAMTINGMVNTTGGSTTGSLTINNGGRLSNNLNTLYLDGSAGTTVNAGGRITTRAGSTIELSDLLVNNGNVNGTLDVDQGGVAEGTGTYNSITLNPGGIFSPGSVQSPASLSAISGAFIIPAGGNQASAASINLAADTTVTVNSPDQLSLTGPINGAGHAFTKTGTGSVSLSQLTAGNLNITTGSVSILPGSSAPSAIGGLTIAAGSTLDLTNNALIVNYNGPSPLGTIQSYIAAAYDHGSWNLPGLTSSSVSTHSATAIGFGDNTVLNKTTFDNQSVAPDAVLLRYTWLGDANLDGIVNGVDLALISSSGSTWSSGDFNYDGVVNADDYALYTLGAAYGSNTNISATLPEPTGLSIAALGASCAVARRRK